MSHFSDIGFLNITDDNFMDNLKILFDDEESYKQFSDTITENAELILKCDQDNDMLFCKAIVKYCKENNIGEIIKNMKKEA